jgi:hypothetical protein
VDSSSWAGTIGQTVANLSSGSIILGWYNRPSSGQPAKWIHHPGLVQWAKQWPTYQIVSVSSHPKKLTKKSHCFNCRLSAQSQSQSYITAEVNRAVCLGVWHPSGAKTSFCYCQTVVALLIWCALFDERTGILFTISVGPRQSSHSRIRVP